MFRLICAAFLAACACAQPTVEDLLREKTLAELRRYQSAFDGVLGVAAIDLETGSNLSLNGDTVFAQASVIKLPILVSMYHAARAGKFRLDDKVTVAPPEAVGGSGRLQFALKKGPVTLTVRQLLTAMIVDSDNTATNRCIDMAGMEAVNHMLSERGFPKTRLLRKMMDATAAAEGRENLSTPNEMARFVEQIYRARLVDAEAGREILDIMRRVRGGFREGLPLDTETASKVGELPGTRSETGIVFLEHRPFVLSVMSGYMDDRHSPVADVTRTVYRMFEKLAQSNSYGRRIR